MTTQHGDDESTCGLIYRVRGTAITYQSHFVAVNCFACDHGLGAARLVLYTDDDDLLLLLENLERCRRKLHLLIRHDVGQHRHWHGRDGFLALRLLLVGRWLDDDGALALRWRHACKSARGLKNYFLLVVIFEMFQI